MDAVPASISRRDVLLVTKDDIDEGHADRFLSVLRQIVSARR
jgi:hypothetical protein